MSSNVSFTKSNPDRNNMPVLQASINDLKQAYHFADFDQALKYCSEIKTSLATLTEQFDGSEYYFYDSLVVLAKLHFIPMVDPNDRQLALSRVANNQLRLQESETHNLTTQYRYTLVDAETHCIAGNKEEAIDQYDLAIALAKKDKHASHEALANELAAKFYQAWGKATFASVHMVEAHNCYCRCGANNKAADLCEKFPQLLDSQLRKISTTQDYSLVESEARYQQLVEDVADLVWSMDADHRFTYLSSQFQHIFGLNPDDWIGRTPDELIHPDDLKIITQAADEALYSGHTMYYEFRHLCNDGSYKWVMIKGTTFFDREGNLLRRQGIVRDISTRKSAELELTQTQIQFKKMTENGPGMLFRCVLQADGSLSIPYIGPQSRDILHVEPEEVMRNPNSLYNYFHPDDIPEHAKSVELSTTALTPYICICRLVFPDEDLRWIKIMSHPEKQDSGDIVFDGFVVDITDIKRLEAEKERQLQILESTSDYIGTCNPQGDITYLNEAIQELAVNSSGERLLRTHISHQHPLWATKILVEQGKPQAAEHGMWSGETAILDGDGNEIPVSQVLVAHKTLNGEVEYFSSICRDIRPQKATERAMEKTGYRLQHVTNNVPGLIYEHLYDRDGSFLKTIFVNSNIKQMYGVDADKAVKDGTTLTKWVHADDLRHLKQQIALSVNNLKPFSAEYRVTPPGQATRWHQTTGRPELLKDRYVSLAGVVLDITDQKAAESTLQQVQTRLHAAAENTPGMIYRYILKADGSHYVEYISSKVEELYGVTVETAMQDASVFFVHVHPDDIDRAKRISRESARTLDPVRVEFRILLPGQGLRWQQVLSQPSRNENGDTIWDGIVLDVTERKSAELRLHNANEQLARATKMKDEFLANMSHELRTPLTAMLSMSEGMERGLFGPVTPEQAEGFDVIQTSGSHLLDMINEVLDLAKIESGSAVLNLSAIEIGELCTTCIKIATQQATKKNVKLILQVTQDLPIFETDEKRVRQILANLVSNAIKFTPAGGDVTLTAELIETDASDFLRLSVKDTGIGIDESDLHTIFEPFVQVETSLNRNYSGTGLGLALVKQFTELLSGTVGVMSNTGTGSTFYIDLPFTQAEYSKSIIIPQKSKKAITRPTFRTSDTNAPANNNPPISILLAEDDEAVAKVTIRYLELLDYRVLRAKDGKETIRIAQELCPDIILMDIQMPGIDGLDVIGRIKQIQKVQETPIIALTGLAMEGDSERCLEAGADRYLSKPYRMQQLIDVMDELLQTEVA